MRDSQVCTATKIIHWSELVSHGTLLQITAYPVPSRFYTYFLVYMSVQKHATCFVHAVVTAVYGIIINPYSTLFYIPDYLYTLLFKLRRVQNIFLADTCLYVVLWFCMLVQLFFSDFTANQKIPKLPICFDCQFPFQLSHSYVFLCL